jgi:hypothetical protein
VELWSWSRGKGKLQELSLVVGKAVLTLYSPLRPLSHNVNPQDGAQDIVVWIMALHDDREETIVNEELIQGNTKIRRRNKDREIAYYDNEAEYYHEERAAFEEQYDDDEQCAIPPDLRQQRGAVSPCINGA